MEFLEKNILVSEENINVWNVFLDFDANKITKNGYLIFDTLQANEINIPEPNGILLTISDSFYNSDHVFQLFISYQNKIYTRICWYKNWYAWH